MTNEKIKELLLSLEKADIDFSVTQTGKTSKKTPGRYIPKTFEILLHDKNFTTENELIYEAIYEYTHHLINCKQKKLGVELKSVNRRHRTEFWAKFDDLLEKALEAKIYKREFSEYLSSLIEEAKKIDCKIVNLQKNFGKILLEIYEKGQKENIRYGDIFLHDLNITVKTVRKCYLDYIDGNFGQDEMELLRKIEDFKTRQNAIDLLKKGKTIWQISESIKQDKNLSLDKKVSLVNEQLRLERIIQQSKERLEIVLETLSNM
ncbi:hypothetical protein [Treponema sp. UBA753]|uniref:hypothetical protein n=1 Tax=Treponema sp. UBA753 TaxID=1947747 RepID=UPI0025FA5E40|nr:hypothetical protein [Treponema sp. UBA753]